MSDRSHHSYSSEEEFLKHYSPEDFDRPSVAADIAAFMIRSSEEESYRKEPKSVLSLLLVKRGVFPFKDKWALPGGFLRADETVEDCALREIIEETNVLPSALMPVAVFSKPDRDPRGRIISHAFASVIGENAVNEKGGDDAAEAVWFDISFEADKNGIFRLLLVKDDISITALLREKETRFGKTSFDIIDSGELAFDHAAIIAAALTALRSQADRFEAIFDFLPERFTLTQLMRVQETITNISVLPANFRRKISELVEETDEFTSGAGHRPAKLYKKRMH